MKRFLSLFLFTCLPATSAWADDTIRQLLKLDESIRSDSITSWYKIHVRPLDSVQALAVINDIEQKALAGKNDIGIATVAFLKGQYFDVKLRRKEEAIRYMQQAVEAAEKYQLDYEWAVFSFQLGVFYFFNDNIPLAIECMLRANDKFKQLGYEKNKYAAWYLYHIAYAYYHLHNYQECLKYLQQARGHFLRDAWIEVQIENTSGLAHEALGNYDSAFVYFDKTLQKAVSSRDTAWIGIASGNIGEVYIKLKDYDKALPYLEKNYSYLKGHPGYGTNGTIVGVLTSMGAIYVAKKDISKALALLNEAYGLWKTTDHNEYRRQAYLYETMSKAYAAQNNFASAYRYQQMGKAVSDSINRRDNALRYTYVQQQLQSEKHMAEVSVLQAQKKAEEQRRNFLLGGIALVLIIGWLIFNRHKLRVQKDNEIRDKKDQLLRSEKLRVEKELQGAQELLNQYLESIREKNDLIEQFREEISKPEHNNNVSQSAEHYAYVQQLSEATLLTDEEWERFKQLFEKVHPCFFVRLKDKEPDLTEADLRLLALTKLNISTRQMAGMLGISPASIHTARYRLRKKLSLSEENFLAEIESV